MSTNYGSFRYPGSVSSSPSTGPNGQVAPIYSTEVGGIGPDGNLHPLSTDNNGDLNVNVVSSVLPTNAAQESGGHLASLDTKLPSQGQALAAASTPVVLPQSQITALTPPTTVTVIQPTGSNLHANIDNFPATQVVSQSVGTNLHVNVDNFPTTQAVSGTVGARVEDGGGTAINSTNASLNVWVNNTGAIQVGQTLGSNLHTVVDSGTINVGNFPATQPVSGTVTVTQATGTNLHTVVDSSALPTGASTSANQTTMNTSLSSIVTNTTRQGTLTDNSGSTSATPSTSTQIMAANTNRKYLLIQNLSTTVPIYINFTSNATAGSGSFYIAPLGSIVQEAQYISTEAVNVLATVASVPYTAKQG